MFSTPPAGGGPLGAECHVRGLVVTGYSKDPRTKVGLLLQARRRLWASETEQTAQGALILCPRA